ncbi:hypothetical protein ACFQ3T_26595, partial [Saccharothrix hoggarensis]
AAAAGHGPAAPVGGAGMMGAGMMGGMAGAPQQGGDKDHKAKVQLAGSTEQVFGKPKKSAPPVLGED